MSVQKLLTARLSISCGSAYSHRAPPTLTSRQTQICMAPHQISTTLSVKLETVKLLPHQLHIIPSLLPKLHPIPPTKKKGIVPPKKKGILPRATFYRTI
jgi:hypothetical protein